VGKTKKIFLAVVALLQLFEAHPKNTSHFFEEISGLICGFVPFPVADIKRTRQSLAAFICRAQVSFLFRKTISQAQNLFEPLLPVLRSIVDTGVFRSLSPGSMVFDCYLV